MLRSLVRALGVAMSIGVPFAILISSGALAGRALDNKLHASPWFLVGGIMLGAAAAIVNLVRVVAWLQRHDDDRH